MASYLYHVSVVQVVNRLLTLQINILHPDVNNFPNEKNFALQLLWETQRVSKNKNEMLQSTIGETNIYNEWWVLSNENDFIEAVTVDMREATSKSDTYSEGTTAYYIIHVSNPLMLKHIEPGIEWNTASYNMLDSIKKYMRAFLKSESPNFRVNVLKKNKNEIRLSVGIYDLEINSFPNSKLFALRLIWEPVWRMQISDCCLANKISESEIVDIVKAEILSIDIIDMVTIIGTNNFPLKVSPENMSEDEYDDFSGSEEQWPTAEYSIIVKKSDYIEHLIVGQRWFSSASDQEFAISPMSHTK